MKANYHTHSARCLHADGVEEDYVRAALEAGLSVLGFSDHAPNPDIDFGLRMPYSGLNAYFAEVERLQRAYEGQLRIRKSLEIEYLTPYHAYYESIIRDHHTDYLILGEHFYQNAAGEIRNIYEAESTADYVDYARSIAAGLRTGYFDIVAHPYLFALNQFAWDDNCDIASDIIIAAAAETNAVLEYNANGLRREMLDYPDGKRYMYPHEKFWRKVAGTGVRVIVGSDSHKPSQIWDEAMDRAFGILAGLGITPLPAMPFDLP